MNLLANLNLEPNFIYETIVTTYNPENNLPNAAPMGVRFLNDQKAVISPFLTTQTYKNLANLRCGVINFTYDLELFFESTFSSRQPKLPEKDFLKAAKINAPRLIHTAAWVEVLLEDIKQEKSRATMIGTIVNWNVTTIPFQPLNRGYYLVLESIIHATRIIAYRDDKQRVQALQELIQQYSEIVEKVAPGGKYTQLMKRIRAIGEKGS